jgi:CheY-like chemotaxis protein
MPVMDGLTAIRELRRREQAGEIDRRYVRRIRFRTHSNSSWLVTD